MMMKRTFLSGLAFAAMLTAFGAGANAQPISVPSKASFALAENGAVTKVGWRVKRRHAKRYRSVRRARVHRGRGFRGPRRSSVMGPYLHLGVASMVIRKCRTRDNLLPGSTSSCE